MPGPPVHWEQLSVVRPKVRPVTSVIWALGAGGVLILVRMVYASYVCNVVKYATVCQPGQGVSSPSLLTAQHFFIGQIQILNTSLKWQHWLNSISTPPQSAPDDIWPLFLDQNIVAHDSSMVTMLLTRPCGAIREWCYQDVFRRSQSLSGVSCLTHAGIKLRITDSCDGPGKMLLLTIRGTIGQWIEQYILQFMIFVVYP